MRNLIWTILIWIGWLLTAVVVLVTLTPLIHTGFWVVRVTDFPRQQMLVTAAVAAVLLIAGLVRSRKVHHKRRALVIGLGLLVAAAVWQSAHVLPFTRYWAREVPHADHADVRVIVCNLDYRNTQREAAAAALAAEDADVLLLIEIDEAWARALSGLRGSYTHHSEEIRGEGLGIALWSRVPLHGSEIRYLVSDKRASIHTDMTIAGRKVAFVGLHPAPPGLPSDDGDRYNSRIRDAELMKVADAVKQRPDHHWIVAGDLNDVAWSDTTKLFKEVSGLEDPRVGRELLNTYHAQRPLLRYPIDHVFLSESFAARHMDRIRIPGADHFAVVIDLAIVRPDSDGPAPNPEAEQEAEEMEREGEQEAAENGENSGTEGEGAEAEDGA